MEEYTKKLLQLVFFSNVECSLLKVQDTSL